MEPDSKELAAYHSLMEKVQGIAQIWGDGWYAKESDYEHLLLREVLLLRETPEGIQRIEFIFWWNELDRISVTAQCHGSKGRYNEHLYNSDDQALLRINLGATRTAKALAADIKRRLIPIYESLWGVSAKRKEATETYKKQQSANVALIATALRSKDIRPTEKPHIVHCRTDKMYGEFDLSSTSATIQLHSVPINFALVLARLIGAQTKV